MLCARPVQLVLCIVLTAPVAALAQELPAEDSTSHEVKSRDNSNKSAWSFYVSHRIHKNGRLWNTITNNGILGNVYGFADDDIYRKAPDYFFPR